MSTISNSINNNSSTLTVGTNPPTIDGLTILGVGKNQNNETLIQVSNTTANTNSIAGVDIQSDAQSALVFVGSSAHSTSTYQNKLVLQGPSSSGTGVAVFGNTINFYSGSSSVLAGTFTSSQTLTLANALTVANGGIGVGTLASNGVLYGNGTSAVQATAAGTTSQVLIGGSGPSFTSTLPSTVQGNITSVGTLASGLVPTSLVKGYTTGTTVSAGYIGQLITASGSGALSGLSTTNMASISLTAGNWIIFCRVNFDTSTATTMPWCQGGIGTDSSGFLYDGSFVFAGYGSTVNSFIIGQGGPLIVSIASTTVYYLNGEASFTGTASVSGSIQAIRYA